MGQLQLDGNKLLHHLDRLNAWQRGELVTPIYVAFSPTSYCNHHCVFCVYHYKEFKPLFFPLSRYHSLVAEWKEIGVRSIFFAGDGDPLLNKSTSEMVALTKTAGVDVALNTNGRLLNDKIIPVLVENLSFIRLSVNAGTRQSYGDIHGCPEGDFDVVLSNISKLVEEKIRTKSKISIGIQCVLLSHNKNEVHILAEKVKNLGVDYFSVKPFLKHPEIKFDDSIPDLSLFLDELSRFADKISTPSFQFTLRKTLFLDQFSRNYKSCLSTDFMIEVDALGDVYSCGPYLGVTEHKLGNIMKTSFDQFWRSEEASQVRLHIREAVDVSKCMPFCRPDSVNQTLWQLKHPPSHVNYI
jgi:cyclic pyranopterin phosphate synthase